MRYVILILSLFACVFAWSQNIELVMRGNLKNSDLGGKGEGGVAVTVVQGGSNVATTSTVSSGKFKLRFTLDKSQPFLLTYSKAGFVTKKMSFDFSRMHEEDVPPGGDFFPNFEIEIFKERPNVDFSFLDTEPVAKFDWDTRNMELRLDRTDVARIKTKIEDLLSSAEEEAEENEKKYNEAIAEADKLFDEEDYESALYKYEESLQYKPQEPHPNQRIVECDALIQAKKKEELAQAQADEKYNNLIAAADNLRDQGSLEQAVSKYQEAIVEKDEQYPKDQITEIRKQIKEKENQAAYDAAISSADAFLKQGSVKAARDKYQDASKLKPSEQYPKDQLAKIEEKLKEAEEAEANQKKYDEAVAAGDQLFDAEDFEGAKAKYEEALTYESSSTYVKGRLQMCEDKLADLNAQKELEEKIQGLLAQGSEQITSTEWESAKATYTEVLGLDAENAEAKEKLALVEQKIEEASNLALQEEQYAQMMEEGNQAYAGDDLETALSKYEGAQKIKDTPDVQAKIEEVKAKLSDQQAAADKEAQYVALIEEAESFMGIIGDVDAAREKYVEASTLFPDRDLPKEKIAEIDALLASQKEAKEKREQYEATIQIADELFGKQNWEEAKAKYEAALTIDDTQDYPKDQIKLADEKIAELQASNEQKAAYDAVINSADALYNQEKWSESKAKYEEAVAIDGVQEYPKGRIAEIDQRMADETAAAEKKAAYDAAIAEADDLLSDSKLEEAKTKYTEALAIDAGQSYPAEQITTIEKMIADQASAEEREAQIQTLLSEGNDLYSQKKLEEAKSKFESVLAIDESNVEAKEKVESLITELAALQSEAEKEAAFQQLKTEGFLLAGQNEYTQAKQKLTEALALKDEQEIKDKLKELDQLIEEEQAANSLNDQYNQIITEAQTLEGTKNYTEAISKYEEALELKSDETLPKTKIEELKALIVSEAENAELDAKYRAFMDKGDELVKENKYLEAINEYNNALAVKPGEQEPVDKAAEAERLAKAEKSEGDAQYEKILTVAQKKIDGEQYDRAVELLKRAKSLKPTDSRPDELLEQIENIKKQEATYVSLMSEGEDLASKEQYKEAKLKFEEAQTIKPGKAEPMERIEEMERLIADQSSEEQKEQVYKDFITKGEIAQSAKNYEEALMHFESAANAKPADQVAKDKIAEVQQILDDIATENEAELALRNKFDAIVSEADDKFDVEDYLNAKEKYEEALTVDPKSAYVKLRIEECLKLEKEKSRKEADREYNKIIAAADKNFNEENWDKAKDYYNRAKSMRSEDAYPSERLIEIENILNPKVLSSGELQDLGDKFDGSLVDALAELEKAEKLRQANKTSAMDETLSSIGDAENEMSDEKYRQHYENSEQITDYYKQISVESVEGDLGRQNTVEVLRKSETERNEVNSRDLAFEKSENIGSQVMLDEIEGGVATDDFEKIGVYADNSDIMKAYNTAQANAITEDVRSDYIQNIGADQEITDVKIAVDQKKKDDREERELVEREVVRIRAEANEIQDDLTSGKYEALLDNSQITTDIQAKVEQENVIKTSVPKDNNLDLVDIRTDYVDAEAEQNQVEQSHAFSANEQIGSVKRKVRADALDDEDNRQATNELLKAGIKELEDAELEMYSGEVEKYLSNKAVIHEHVKVNEEIAVIEDEAHEKKVAYINQMDKKATLSQSQAIEGDELERLNARKSVENVIAGVQDQASEESKKAKDNDAELKNIAKAIQEEKTAEGRNQQDKHYGAQASLNKIDNTPDKKLKLENELGKEYPEGVSQESFTQNDQNGLMKAVVTRRVVVIDGHADVYVRTQTLNGITYTKNGKPSLSHVWNKETQDPKLERHF